MSARLQAQVRQLVEYAVAELGPEHADRLEITRRRLDGPLRVAIAGRVKAGKSTLLNALVGERLAPTDASECTRVVSWYRHGATRQVTLVPAAGEPRAVPWRREDGELQVDFGEWQAEDIHHLDVAWPSRELEQIALIDTPGLASATLGVSARSERYLLGRDDAPGESDAIVYLLRNLHPSDLDFLEAFRGEAMVRGQAINAIGVVSRADEIGGARLNAMRTAQLTAQRYQDDPDLRQRCQVVIPIAGLLAQGSSQLIEGDHQAMRAVAREPLEVRRQLLLSAGRFCTDPDFSVPPIVRRRLIDRIGLFGVRVGVELLVRRDRSASELAKVLSERSGLGELRRLLRVQFAARGRVLKCRTALATVTALARESEQPGAAEVLERARSVEFGAHEFVEMAVLQRIRVGEVDGRLVDLPEVERILGADGAEAWQRLDVAPGASHDELRSSAYDLIGRLRPVAEDALLGRAEREVIAAAVRSLDGIVAELPSPV